MKNLKLMYGMVSVVFLLVLAVSPFKEYVRDWRVLQNEYNESVDELPFKAEKIRLGLKQIWWKETDKVDRCITCHFNISDKKFVDVEKPFNPHSEMYHDVTKYGCTVCHEGQGLATNFEDAHRPEEFWDKPLLPNRYLESSCAKCHENKLNETPLVNLGEDLIKKFNCAGCHLIPGIEKEFAPSLDGIGTKVLDINWLERWLKNPYNYYTNSRMPNFLLDSSETVILSQFLYSFKKFNNGVELEDLPDGYYEKKDDEDFINKGKKLFRETRCISCHAVDGKGGKLAVDLVKIASKANAKWIYSYILNPKKFQSEVPMPKFGFTSEEAAAITAYFEYEFVDWDAEEPQEETTTSIPDLYSKGVKLFNQYNCGGCHSLNIPEVQINNGPELNNIGSKNLYQIDWGKNEPGNSVYEYIEMKIAMPRTFGEGVRMPYYNIETIELEAVTSKLLTYQKNKIPKEFIVEAGKTKEFNPQGDVGKIFAKYACLECHSVYGQGGKIAPDLRLAGSKMYPGWIKDYFKVPYSLRAIVEERMPKLYISDEETDKLIEYFNTVFISDSLDNLQIELTDNLQSIEEGRTLFSEKYGCDGCHIAEGKGGYVGPPLDEVGRRLKKGWLYTWLTDPRKLEAETIEPVTNMSREEKVFIMSYLYSLGK